MTRLLTALRINITKENIALGCYISVISFVVLLTYFVCRIVPYFLTPPDVATFANTFINNAWKHCLPEPVEQARYLIVISMVPTLFFATAIIAWFLRDFISISNPFLIIAFILNGLFIQAGAFYFCYERITYADYMKPEELHKYAALAAVIGSCSIIFFNRWISHVALCVWRSMQRINKKMLSNVCQAAGVSLSIYCLLPSVFFDQNLNLTDLHVRGHMEHIIAEFSAAIIGKTSLVDYFPQYNYLLPYFLMPYFKIVGFSTTSFSIAMNLLSLLGLLSIFYGFIRVTGSTLLGLILYFPVLCIASYPQIVTSLITHNAFNYHAVWPLRYMGPFCAYYLLNLSLPNLSFTRIFVLSFAASLIAINNIDFGFPALVGTLAAFILGKGFRRVFLHKEYKAILGISLLGVFSGALCFLVFLYLRTGKIPVLSLFFEFQKIFAVSGFFMLPAPEVGPYWVVCITFLSLFLIAIWRFVFENDESPSAVLKRGIYSYVSIFGCGALMYYVGRSHPDVLIAIFPIWGLALMLLLVEVLVAMKKCLTERDVIAYCYYILPLCILVFHFIMMSSIWGVLPSLNSQIIRLKSVDDSHLQRLSNAKNFVKKYAATGESVIYTGDRGDTVTSSLGVFNVFPFPVTTSLIIKRQIGIVSDVINEKGVKKVFTHNYADGDLKNELSRLGFYQKDVANIAVDGGNDLLEYWLRK